MSFPIERFLARVGLDAAPAPTEDGLRVLHEAAVRSFTFENFDVLSGAGVSLDPERVEAKLLGGDRGGYCFELNGLFLRALDALGFEARALLGRVLARWDPSTPPPPKLHQVSLVEIDGRPWIADVGFGGGLPFSPMRLEADTETGHLGETLRYVEHALGWMLQKREGGDWRRLYVFDLSVVHPADIAVANHFTSTHPESPFVRMPILSRVVDDHRWVLYGDQLSLDGAPHGQAPDGDALTALLADRFGLRGVSP